jgi:coproporphyrinogen III oxidase-like Fe-S oxidoreductase
VETIMLQLRLVSGLDLAEMRTSTGFSIDQICESSLRRFEQRGLLLHEEDRIRITDLGFEILDSIILSLVEELEGASDEKRFDSSNGSDDGTANPSSSGLDRG